MAAVALASRCAVAAGASAGLEPAPDRVCRCRALEYDLLLSKPKLTPGRRDRPVRQRRRGLAQPAPAAGRSTGAPRGPELGLGEVEPGAYENLDAHLHRGSTYELWCSLKDHRAKGMDATVRTKRHRHRGR